MFIVIYLRNPTVPVPHFGVEGWAVFRFKVRMPRALLRRFGAVRVRVVGLGVFLGLACTGGLFCFSSIDCGC